MQSRKKTRIKSFRLDESVIEGLGRAAKRARVTESRFLSELLESRLMIDPLLPAFQDITMGVDAFRAILNSADADALEAAAADVAQRNMPLPLELYESSGHSLGFHEFVTNILARYGRWFTVEGNINKTRGWVTLRHGHGPKWSRFLKGYLVSSYSIFSKEKLNVTIADQFVRITFENNHE